MKICKKTITIFLALIILLYSIIPPKIAYAEDVSGLTQDRAGEILATFAVDFYNRYGDQTEYCDEDLLYEHRQQAYNGNMVNGKYHMDCVGWINFAVHHSLNMNTVSGGYSSGFAVPPGNMTTGFRDGFECVYGNEYGGSTISKDQIVANAKKGDILFKNGQHVLLYVGNGMVVHCNGRGPNGSGLSYESIYNLSYEFCAIGRITVDAAANIRHIKETWDGQPPVGGGVITPSVDDSEAFDQYINSDFEGTVDVNGRNNSSSFYYNGTPKKGEYLGKTKGNWLFNTLSDAADWLLGILTMGIKAQLVGWASIFEGVANNVVEGVTDIELLTERVTVEDVIYNRIPILDVNLFNFEKAGGYDLEQTDLIYMLRQKIAEWYVAIRTVCIILLLFTLIYLGIRTAIASVAQDKSEYKQKLVSWVVSFLIVMFIHYFMILVLHFNEIAVGWITPPEGSSATLYEQMRSYAYEIPATKGWTGAIIYVFLVYYLIKMLFFYFKRVLIVYILAILSPAMGIAYSIQRINGKSKALGVWVKEFTFNVIIQFVHALIYTIMMALILTIIPEATPLTLVPFSILLFVLLGFILDVEDIIKNIFQIKANSLKSIVQTMFSLKNRFLPAVLIGGAVYKKGKSMVVNAYDKSLTNSLNLKYDKYKVDGTDEISQSINKEIERLKQQEKEHTMQLSKASIDFAKSKLTGTIALVTAVPAVFEKPIAGAAAFAVTAGALSTGFEGSGKYENQAEALEKSTDGTNYIYIDDPNEVEDDEDIQNGNQASGGNTSTTDGSSGEVENETTEENTSQKTIRTYNTAKNKTYKFPKAVLSATASIITVGAYKTARNTATTAIKEHKTIETVYRTRIEKLSVIGKLALKEVNTINKELDRIKNRKLSSNILRT